MGWSWLLAATSRGGGGSDTVLSPFGLDCSGCPKSADGKGGMCWCGKPVGLKVLQFFPRGLWRRVPGWWAEVCGAQGSSGRLGCSRRGVRAVRRRVLVSFTAQQVGPQRRAREGPARWPGWPAGLLSLLPTLPASHFQTGSTPWRTYSVRFPSPALLSGSRS